MKRGPQLWPGPPAEGEAGPSVGRRCPLRGPRPGRASTELPIDPSRRPPTGSSEYSEGSDQKWKPGHSGREMKSNEKDKYVSNNRENWYASNKNTQGHHGFPKWQSSWYQTNSSPATIINLGENRKATVLWKININNVNTQNQLRFYT